MAENPLNPHSMDKIEIEIYIQLQSLLLYKLKP
jgi:hypothetical protein